jgi:hypothetical protein
MNHYEQKAFDLLKKINGSSIWHIAIQNCKTEDAPFLIHQLYTEGILAPRSIISIIGVEAWKAVRNCFDRYYYDTSVASHSCTPTII